MAYIYCLKDEDCIYYVGRTINLESRKYAHIRKSFQRSDMKDIIIQRQLKDGIDIVLHILEECSESEMNAKEIEWIKKIAKQGSILNNVTHNSEPFSASELNILQLIVNGYSSKEIANMTFRSTKTIEAHRYNMIKKANVKSFAQLVYWAMKHHVIN